jgi:hypothetical protein
MRIKEKQRLAMTMAQPTNPAYIFKRLAATTSTPVSHLSSSQDSSLSSTRTSTTRTKVTSATKSTTNSAQRRREWVPTLDKTTPQQSLLKQPLILHQPHPFYARNAVATQQAGARQLLADQVAFLCAATDAASLADLVVLVSDERNRRAILTTNDSTDTTTTTTTTSDRFDSIVAMLESFAVDPTMTDTQLRHGVCLLLHFLTVDCCGKDAKHARHVRLALLRRPAFLRATCEFVSSDPLTCQVLRLDKVDDDDQDGEGSAAESVVSETQSSTPSFSSSTDPTLAGRRKKRRLVFGDSSLKTISEGANKDSDLQARKKKKRATDAEDDDLSFAGSVDSAGGAVNRKLDLCATMALMEIPDATEKPNHTCAAENMDTLQVMPLMALSRIIKGKMERSDQLSCLEVDTDESMDGFDDEETNPLILTNRFIGESNVIPILVTALSDTLVALCKLLKQNMPCPGCVARLHDRMQILVAIVDEASLFNDDNRVNFCREGYQDEFGGELVIGLFFLLKLLLEKKMLFKDVWGDVTLDVTRTLTSLTHENAFAASEAAKPLEKGKEPCGFHVLANVVRCATEEDGLYSSKLKYDAVIFCLNSSANMVESGGSREVWTEMMVPSLNENNSEEILYLKWLTEWLVSQTEHFRKDLIDRPDNLAASKPSTRQLDSADQEKLVVCGNGFVFLACLMINNNSSNLEHTLKTRELILCALPGHDKTNKVNFLGNSLKAFCNFYTTTIGDLSVAVVVPVKALIAKLEQMQ